jgi:hypothetical protein
MEAVSNLIDKFKGLWYGEGRKDVEGYLIMSDSTNNRSLLMVKENDKSWKTKWFNNAENTYKTPNEPLNKLFK